MRELPKINQLKNLRAIIQYGSIRTAAQSLHQTQPAMTRSIQELEKILGVSLLVRGVHGAELTAMGRIFEPRMNLVLNELERAMDELEQIERSSEGLVTFGCSHLPALAFVPDVIKNFQTRYTTARITVAEGQLSELLNSLRLGRLDFFIGLVSPEISLREFVDEHLAVAQFAVIARKGHPLANSTSLSELQGAKWYLPTARAGFYNDIGSLIFPYGKEPTSSVIFGNSATIAEQLILNEDYLFVGPKVMATVSSLQDIISVIPVKEKMPDGHYSLIYRRQQSLTPMAKRFMDDIRFAYLELMSRQTD
ncbi:transcriptional regulator [Yersinia frederiksenii]|uniref:Transcriptional regulator n=2 Tax=Yersinia frederiksenii TaxID=29484 RepID=A0A380PSA6_YERFR|nr:LysR substrate-binding domain-containing protein [Yersinia frederiksenii]ATM95032.1 LysR family transcriptional regulator [Yersinia frederiksenii]EEQ13560.1 Transcriptional regulator, LysR family [Yersinia frederiksenii ATCC 33641]KGA47445.1 bacterial regulatory helix-turn-helix, lysR family protein [Yersinia frederiksenii ATCC 33641]MDN0119908.1 LysR substrate-binding domain-containing protein [Yersinia frederiksenii]CFR03423.1 transcriptional regulator [Yersinia frederiksenii]